MEPQPDFVEPDGKAMSRTFHLPTTPSFYEPAVAALDQRFAAEDKECDMQHLVEQTCALNGAPLVNAPDLESLSNEAFTVRHTRTTGSAERSSGYER